MDKETDTKNKDAISQLKTYLEENRYIHLRELIMGETLALTKSVEKELGPDGGIGEP